MNLLKTKIMKNNLLHHIDTWIKLILNHLDKHKMQGIIFFTELGITIMIWAVIMAFYLGKALYNIIIKG